ncbi:sigma-70 family RNA polymerase sigma factor [Streptomyces sp. BI20]|uniref:sigma-70 family RNA polymerase sigma factor n=1 Tax=Streptomyces sp. BI20 TaxID=3403460 RepID=UPI003C753F0B
MDTVPVPTLPSPRPAAAFDPLLSAWGPLLAAEAAAEAPAAGLDPADLEQAVWLRLLEGEPPAGESGRWVARAVREEARAARRRARREVPCADPARPPGARRPQGPVPEEEVVHREQERVVRSAVARLPGRCPQLIGALLSPRDLTYREIAGELGISQGSLGPVRSRCLGCLRRMLAGKVPAPGAWGREP